MAKKKTALTIEERLQQALVPANEQPYDVPENWVWCRLGSVAEIITGGTPSKKHPEYYGGDFPFYKPSDLDQGRLTYDASEYLSEDGKNVARFIPKYSTAVCCIGSIGKCGYLMYDGTTNQQINSAIPKFDSLYLYYYLCTDSFVQNLLLMASATTISIVNKTKMENCFFPLPPLAEQKRIVDRIEELFAKLDEAKEKLQEVIDGFAVRKAAILHKAFTGELTKNWRAENGVSDDSWEEKNFDEVANIKSNLVSPFDYLDYPHIAPDSIEKFTGRLLSYRSVREDNVKSPKHLFYKGQILYSKIRPYLSKAVIAEVDGLCSADMYPIEALCNAKYLLRYMLSTEFLVQSTTAGSRSLLPKINQKELSAIKVPLPSLPEQHEIVRLLDALLARERKAQQAAKEALTNIELMKKAVLARAFRGELGTNREEEASALALLKEVLE